MRIHHSHLPATYPRADVRHPVIVTYRLMLVVRVRLARLRRIPHDAVFLLRRRTHQRASSRGRDHLVAVERKHAVAPEGAQHLPVEARAESLRRVLDDRDAVPVRDLHDTVDAVRHPVQRHRHDRLRHPAGPRHPVPYRLLQQFRIHVPRIRLRIHEHRLRPQISDRMRARAERKRLHQNLIPRPHAAAQQPQMHRRRPRRQRHDLLVHPDESLQIGLEPIHIRPQRHHPIGVESLLNILLLNPLLAHMREAKVNTLTFRHISYNLNIQLFPIQPLKLDRNRKSYPSTAISPPTTHPPHSPETG